MAICRAGQDRFKKGQKVKEVLTHTPKIRKNKDEDTSQGHKHQLAGAPTGQFWDDLSMKKLKTIINYKLMGENRNS